MKTVLPTPDQVRQLPELLRLRVPPEWEDLNGHVNVKHHLGMYDLTNDPLLEMLGISEDWVRTERVGMFDLEHHIWYQNEVHVGDEVALFIRITERNLKRLQGIVFLLNVSQDRLASAVEFVSTGANLETRRTMPLPAHIAERLDDLIRQQATLDWPAPRSGAISI
jgi:acyl-CoA thioester hydrolase